MNGPIAGAQTGETLGAPNTVGPGSGPAEAVFGAVQAVSAAPVDIDAVLADALNKAAAAGRFDVVAQLARELEARRLARDGGNVVVLDGLRRERGE